MMEAARTSETSVDVYQTTRRNNTEDSHLHTRRRENLNTFSFDLFIVFNSPGKPVSMFSLQSHE
jgi:hypothetical protein